MGKYIINLRDTTDRIVCVGVKDGETYASGVSVSCLTPYTAPDLEQVREEVYEKGLSDAWDAARKIVLDTDKGGIPLSKLQQVFHKGLPNEIIGVFSASEAIEKIRQYEQEKEEQDGLRQNIQTIVDKCGYSLDEIATVLEKMRGEQDG